jgi:hypothetical protein
MGAASGATLPVDPKNIVVPGAMSVPPPALAISTTAVPAGDCRTMCRLSGKVWLSVIAHTRFCTVVRGTSSKSKRMG